MDNKQIPAKTTVHTPFVQTYFHGTKADVSIGDYLKPGYASNFEENKITQHIYFSATLDAAVWGSELALGDGRQRIYLVEPTGSFEDDPDLTDKKFPGNPSLSYRSLHPLKVVGEIKLWQGHPDIQVQQMREVISRLIKKT